MIRPSIIVETPDTPEGHRYFTLPGGIADPKLLTKLFDLKPGDESSLLDALLSKITKPGTIHSPNFIGYGQMVQQQYLLANRGGLARVALVGVQEMPPAVIVDVDQRLRELVDYLPSLVGQLAPALLRANMTVQSHLLTPFWNEHWAQYGAKIDDMEAVALRSHAKPVLSNRVFVILTGLVIAGLATVYVAMNARRSALPIPEFDSASHQQVESTLSPSPLPRTHTQTNQEIADTILEEVRKGDLRVSKIASRIYDNQKSDASRAAVGQIVLKSLNDTLSKSFKTELSEIDGASPRSSSTEANSTGNRFAKLYKTASEYVSFFELLEQPLVAEWARELPKQVQQQSAWKVKETLEQSVTLKVTADAIKPEKFKISGFESELEEPPTILDVRCLDKSSKPIDGWSWSGDPGKPERPLMLKWNILALLDAGPDSWEVTATSPASADSHFQFSGPFGHPQEPTNSTSSPDGSINSIEWILAPESGQKSRIRVTIQMLGPVDGQLVTWLRLR